jgi:hypothetical protein
VRRTWVFFQVRQCCLQLVICPQNFPGVYGIVVVIDGSHGEGGGQIIRTSSALSLVTGEPFRVERVSANREPPGLRQQHLTAVNAAAEIGQGQIEGAVVGSTEFISARQCHTWQLRLQYRNCG